jgi:hypothetical protein
VAVERVNKKIIAIIVFICVTIAVSVLIITGKSIPQDPSYHDFADHGSLALLPNFLNVISNAAFILAGLLGLFGLFKKSCFLTFIENSEKTAYYVLFSGLILTGLGSAWYHLNPDDYRLLWDRLPMTIIFMSFFATLITERISIRAGMIILPVLLVLGIASAVYWYIGELTGHGDLRPYVMVQFYPVVSIPIILLLFKSRYDNNGKYLIAAMLLYAAAKAVEVLDRQIYSATGFISGHTLKHLIAAASTYMILLMLKKRTISRDFEGDQ